MRVLCGRMYREDFVERICVEGCEMRVLCGRVHNEDFVWKNCVERIFSQRLFHQEVAVPLAAYVEGMFSKYGISFFFIEPAGGQVVLPYA